MGEHGKKPEGGAKHSTLKGEIESQTGGLIAQRAIWDETLFKRVPGLNTYLGGGESTIEN